MRVGDSIALTQKINELPAVVANYERGGVVPNQQAQTTSLALIPWHVDSATAFATTHMESDDSQ